MILRSRASSTIIRSESGYRFGEAMQYCCIAAAAAIDAAAAISWCFLFRGRCARRLEGGTTGRRARKSAQPRRAHGRRHDQNARRAPGRRGGATDVMSGVGGLQYCPPAGTPNGGEGAWCVAPPMWRREADNAISCPLPPDPGRLRQQSIATSVIRSAAIAPLDAAPNAVRIRRYRAEAIPAYRPGQKMPPDQRLGARTIRFMSLRYRHWMRRGTIRKI